MKTIEQIKQLAEDFTTKDHGHYHYRGKDCFVKGYTQCQEDMADKKYTEEDVIKAIEMAREGIRVTRISEWETEKEFDYNDYQIINSLNKQD